ncbi:MAG: RsmE family RNA methyltransferase [Nitrospinota bacterium]
MSHTFFISEDDIDDNIVSIRNGDAHHIGKVLRLKGGATINVTIPNQVRLTLEIIEVAHRLVRATIIDSNPIKDQLKVKVSLYASLLKHNKIDDLLRFTVELGISSFTPIIAKRSVKVPDQQDFNARTDRWQQIAKSAAMQSMGAAIPTVNKIQPFNALKGDADLNIILYELEENVNLAKLIADQYRINKISSINVVVGPEGGFTKEEIALALKLNFRSVRLGAKLLRAETASIAAIAVIAALD